jgi:uncharacterized protein
MTEQARRSRLLDEMRDHVLTDPGLILEDPEMMKALIAANDRAIGENIVDLRGVALRRLEGQLDRLEDTHRGVIAAAYENLAGANIVQRAILQLLEPLSFEAFLAALTTHVAPTLRVDSLRLVLESQQASAAAAAGWAMWFAWWSSGVCRWLADGGAQGPVAAGGVAPGGCRQRPGAWRPGARISGPRPGCGWTWGRGVCRAMLVLGSEDPHQFRPGARHRSAGAFRRRVRADDAPLAGVTDHPGIAPAWRDALAGWLRTRRCEGASPATVDAYGADVARWLAFLADHHGQGAGLATKLGRCPRPTCGRFMAHEQARGVVSRGACAAVVGSVKAFTRWIADRSGTDATAVLALRGPRYRRKLPRPIWPKGRAGGAGRCGHGRAR